MARRRELSEPFLRPGVTLAPTLFMQPTISKDDTLGAAVVEDSLDTQNETEHSTHGSGDWRKALQAQRKDGLPVTDGTGHARLQGQVAPSWTDERVTTLAGRPNITLALSSLADEYLYIDILDENRTSSQYMAFLLDVIHNLQARLEFQKRNIKPLPLVKEDQTEAMVLDKGPRSLVLHRVFCGTSHHDHNATVYEDAPTLINQDSGASLGEEMLCGKVVIGDVGAYLRKQNNVQFVVYKEYRCGHVSSWGVQKQRRKDESLATAFNMTRSDISPRQERMKIVSPTLQRALNGVATCKLDKILFEDSCEDSEELQAPYMFLFHHRRQLQEVAQENQVHGPSVKFLLEYLNANFGQEYIDAEAMIARGLVAENNIDKLFKPNQIVVTQEKGIFNAYMLDEWPVKKSNRLLFSGWQWSYNGWSLYRNEWQHILDLNFLDEKHIKTLEVRPIDYVEEDVIIRLRERGNQFWSMKRQRLVSYDGWDYHHSYFYSRERFMVDMATYAKIHGSRQGLKIGGPDGFDSMPRIIPQDDSLTDDQSLLLPPTMHGYSLREKKWVSINIDQMSDVVWNKKAFKRLVLDSETKDLISALIDVRMSDSKKMDDLVVGKGNGLIMLLHGSPGTGKTLTAESVAEFAEKPLYRVTCGDMGTEAMDVEKYLETVLYLAKIWNCVLLLDEADVFLEERSVSDLQRNSLVSVFLRVLEYYEGIMILTSNRVGTFDEAFQSRIRVALRYEPLTFKSRKAIWRNFFDMLDDDDDDIKVNIRGLDDRLEELAAYKMNGRQIRNVLLTARQLALHRQESLEWKHLSQVLILSDNFSKYLKDIRGGSSNPNRMDGKSRKEDCLDCPNLIQPPYTDPCEQDTVSTYVRPTTCHAASVPDPASMPPLPIEEERILELIHNALDTMHKQPLPYFYSGIDAVITRLVQVGMKISAKHEGQAVEEKLNGMAEVSRVLGAVRALIDSHLIRNRREVAIQRCVTGHLTLWLSMVDAWLSCCEQFARKNKRHFSAEVAVFEDPQRELTAIAREHGPDKSYGFDSFVQLFDYLGLINA
ncbi:hypothetical protein JX266_001788 [Neoarthrinium moseri]|nr:hypothetical protein JX266_001788 [Neoarthrinium moseri]